ncbi:hypothetical protein AJ80_08196 [Polytolypa hystricis UAMH7299]|uniref:GYF domain-containing protein n=1 Tax=Polytolypa hystricis (strain UAMH7299) TaxID=1447883 RepID=A0A2B7XC05_POLH7|nr:hypothetical protein AJ80_08196 [Polytolypa hystricis UAMH7299]
MPSPLPSSFASAAAGSIHDSSGSRRDGIGNSEWSRNRTNGATQTFRRPSLATNTSYSRENISTTSSTTTPTVAAYIPPHLNSNYQSGFPRNGSANDSRYSKEQLLNLYKSQVQGGNLGKQLSDHFMADWNPHDGTPTTNGAWGKREDFKDNHNGPEVCWDHDGQVQPLALTEMNDEEKELFSTSVNSPLKPPPQSASKENVGAVGTLGRKTSVSHSQSHLNSFNTSSPGSTRPGPRRRGTGDSIGNTMSPTANSRFFRDESTTSTPPPSLLRRKTDFRDSSSELKAEEKDKEPAARDTFDLASPFGSLKRSVTNPVVSGTGNGSASSPWPTTSSHGSSFAPMGSFGSFSLGPMSAQSPTADKKASFGSLRGESRFKSLLSKDSSEDIGAIAKEKPPVTSLDRLPENENPSIASNWAEGVKTRPIRSETNPFEEPRSGSAALGGQDMPLSEATLDHLGLVSGFRDLVSNQQDHSSQTPSRINRREPLSPTNTNPYQSPHGERVEGDDIDTDGSDVQNTHLPGLSALRDETSMGAFGPIQRTGSAMDVGADRSQTSSVGANRGFPSLGGLGGLSNIGSAGWPTSSAVGTPTRERSAFATGFGDPIFGSMSDLQSPSLSTLGSGGFFGTHSGLSGSGTTTRASKMGSLFPTAMQEQMRNEQPRQDAAGNEGAIRTPGEGASRGPINPPASTNSSQIATPATVAQTPASNPPSAQDVGSQVGQSSSQPQGTNSASAQLPASQKRQMVMPDRMRWIYRDPQGNIQGPWSGLEMHDWFKAGFFTAELQVKKLEDAEYEPLAQLVRRIGNSREPFLVPQIGVPHGPEPPQQQPPPQQQQQGGAWTSNPTGVVQPPFPSSFPSFGTTLTAEQQNALERRKQEEQYLMARQKEHLAQQQVLMKQMQIHNPPHPIHHPQLQHHSSAHSLHSQPSYGSITSPGGYQPSPIQGPIQPPQQAPGYFEPPARQTTLPTMAPQMPGFDPIGTHEGLPNLLDRLNINRPAQFPFGPDTTFTSRPQEGPQNPAVASMLQDRARLQQEQEQFDRKHADSIFDQQAREERLRQFHALRQQTDNDAAMRRPDGLPTHPAIAPVAEETGLHDISSQEQQHQQDNLQSPVDEQPLSLTQQVQKAASAQQQQHQQLQPSANAADDGLPRPFPPPPSASPLPAPAAQRNRQNVADALAASSRSQTQTPIETPTASVAPWAKDTIEAPKGPSLKEIQEAEARKAAKLEEIAAAARRALAEQERAIQPPTPTPGLPSTANWASAASPASPAPSPWAKSVVGKPQGTPPLPAKKTLAQIQKEEETRKQRLAAANNAPVQASAPTVSSGGKRYADLASKVAPAPAATLSSGAWTTVGAGGKAKALPASPTAPRAVSGNVGAPAPIAPKARPTTVTRTSAFAPAPANNPNQAIDALTSWANMALGKGLNSYINVDDFVQQLLILPADTEIISDSVYANSQTLDGRRFAEEFVRRRRLADKGVTDPASLNAGSNGFGTVVESKTDGWNEVAKKGNSTTTHREDNSATAAFKVVAAKKKGKK